MIFSKHRYIIFLNYWTQLNRWDARTRLYLQRENLIYTHSLIHTERKCRGMTRLTRKFTVSLFKLSRHYDALVVVVAPLQLGRFTLYLTNDFTKERDVQNTEKSKRLLENSNAFTYFFTILPRFFMLHRIAAAWFFIGPSALVTRAPHAHFIDDVWKYQACQHYEMLWFENFFYHSITVK